MKLQAGNKIKVYLNSKDRIQRELVECEVVKELPGKVRVKLPDGNIIERKKNRDLVLEKEGKI